MNFQSRGSHSNLLLESNHISILEDKILTENILFINKSFNNLLPLIFKSWFTFCSDVHSYQTVSSTTDKIFKPSYRTNSYGKKLSHLLLTKYLNYHIELILTEKTQSSTTDKIFKSSYRTDSYGKKLNHYR